MASPFADYPTVLRHLETRLLVADLKDLLKDRKIDDDLALDHALTDPQFI